MFVRIISGIIGLPVLVFIVYKGNFLLWLSLIIVNLIGLKEFYNSFINLKIKPLNYIGYLFTILLYISFYYSKFLQPKVIIYMIVLLLLCLNVFSKKDIFQGILITLLSFFYISYPLYYIILIRNEYYKFTWLIFIIAMATDTFAYFSGCFLGKKKLIPSVSPNKTVEGSIGGVLGALLSTSIYSHFFIKIPVTHVVILSLLGSIISQLGDLIASKIKRITGIKDFGNLIPGHGGILDRFDSIIFLSPLIYFYVNIFINK